MERFSAGVLARISQVDSVLQFVKGSNGRAVHSPARRRAPQCCIVAAHSQHPKPSACATDHKRQLKLPSFRPCRGVGVWPHRTKSLELARTSVQRGLKPGSTLSDGMSFTGGTAALVMIIGHRVPVRDGRRFAMAVRARVAGKGSRRGARGAPDSLLGRHWICDGLCVWLSCGLAIRGTPVARQAADTSEQRSSSRGPGKLHLRPGKIDGSGRDA